MTAPKGADGTIDAMGKTRFSGKLELTWTNKDLALLDRDDGGYEWVPPHDRRVAEIRLLRDAGEIGTVRTPRAADNLLIHGEALNALKALNSLPEFAAELQGQVRLCYIDPPFNTGQAFEHYDDNVEYSVWLTMMRDRLKQAKELLAPNGSVWVHLDDRHAHHARVLLDELFGMDCFVGEVVWEMTDARKMDAEQFSLAHNRILVYSRAPDWRPNRYPGVTDEAAYPHLAPDGRRYSRRELRKWGKNSLRKDRENLWYPITAPDGTEVWPIRPDGKDGCWRWQQSKVAEDYERLDWVETERGIEPYVMTFMEDGKKPKPPRTLWTTEWMPGNPAAREQLKALFPGQEPFDTPKPEELLREVVFLGSDPGDIVLDFFGGSGTTAAVAHKMGRRWVVIERRSENIDRFIAPRLRKVVAGEDPGGITEEFAWEGGGGFRALDVAPSMYAEYDGSVVLSEWTEAGQNLAEAVAAQVGFEFTDDQPFCGRAGKRRLAVIDGFADMALAEMLLGMLDAGEKLALYSTSHDPLLPQQLRARSRGSVARLVPRDILAGYATPALWRVPDALRRTGGAAPADADVAQEETA